MRKAVLSVLLVSSVLLANYSTPGTGRRWNLDSLVVYSGGNVTGSGGLYFVNDTITLSVSDTLFILAPNTIKMAYQVVFNVDGTLINRPSVNKVLFTAIDSTQMYFGFTFSVSSGASVFKNAIVEYAGGVRLIGSGILIDSCIFRHNTLVSNFTSGAVSLSNSSPVISNSTFVRSGRSAIISAGNLQSSPVIINNTFLDNGVANVLPYPQINLGGAASTQLVIRGNIIRGSFSQAGGIAIFPVGSSIPNLLIEGNIIKHNSYGIVLYNTPINAVIIGNIIDSNNTNPNPLAAGSGININGNANNVCIIARNKIRWNLWGITIQGTALPSLGKLNSPDTTDKGRNEIWGNGHNDSTIDLYNNTPDSIWAQNNFWGTANLDTVEAHIVHHPDISTLGWVIYTPIYLPVGITQTGNSVPVSFILHEPYPNPFNPSSNITFDVPQGTSNFPVRLEVIDMLGREVTVLVNEQLKAGKYRAVWEASAFSSGVYFCRLSSGNYHDTRKLILLK